MLSKLLHTFLRRGSSVDDCVFQLLLEKEFWRDLTTVMNLYMVPSYQRDDWWEKLYDLFMDKYQHGGQCPSESISSASSSQQQEYWMIHQLICHFFAGCEHKTQAL